MKKKVISAALAGTLAVSLLSACGASNEPQNISDVSSAASSEATSTTASSESTGDAAQELTFVLSNIPDGLDPSVTNNSFAQYVLINCFEGLVTYDSTGTLVPGNAESWDISDDGLTYTFHLRDGLKWSDGSDLTAEDYVYTIQRVLTPATAAQYVSMATDYIKNAQEYYDGTATADDLGVKALDDKTLEITLLQPTSYFIDILSMWTFSPVQKATVEANGDKWSTEADTYVCNGPFKIASMSMNENVILEKNENYWDADSVKLEKVTYSIMTDETTYYNAFSSGQLDMVTVTTKDYVDMFQGQDKNYAPYLSANLAFNFFNIKDKLFSNVNIRKAFTLAVDREEFNEVCYDGMRVPTYGWVVPTMTVGETNYRETAGDNIKVMQEELAAEGKTPKDLLLQGMQELGLGNDPSTLDVTFSFGSTSTLTRNIGEYLQQVFKTKLGVEIETSFNEWGIFNSNVQSGDYQAGFMGWGAYYNDPYDTLSLLLTGSTAINTGWGNEEYDSILNAATAEMDEATRMQEYIKAEQILINEECVVSPMATNQVQRFFQPYVKGYSDLGFTNTGSKYIHIEK